MRYESFKPYLPAVDESELSSADASPTVTLGYEYLASSPTASNAPNDNDESQVHSSPDPSCWSIDDDLGEGGRSYALLFECRQIILTVDIKMQLLLDEKNIHAGTRMPSGIFGTRSGSGSVIHQVDFLNYLCKILLLGL